MSSARHRLPLILVSLLLSAATVTWGQSSTAVGARQGLPRTQVVQGCQHYRVAPRHYIVIACGDGNLYLNGLQWRYWHRYDARGHGYLVANDCDPSCAEGHFHRYPARFHLTRARTDHGHFVFHHVTVRFTGNRPAHPRYLKELQLVGHPV
jgi:hypothetical protein